MSNRTLDLPQPDTVPTAIEPYGIIYRATHTESGMVYVGQTTGSLGRRRGSHIDSAKRLDPERLSRFGNALRKHGADAFAWEIIDSAASRQELDDMERYWIKHYRSTDRDRGYNLTDGGAVSILGEESRRKSSETKKRRFRTGECRAHNRGMAMNPEQRMLLRDIRLNASESEKQHTSREDDPRRGTRPSRATEFPSVRIQCVETGEIYETMSRAARSLGISHTNFSSYFAGRVHSVGGRQWIKL